MGELTKRMMEEVYELARTMTPSSIRCVGSTHRPACSIPLYHNKAEETLRAKILSGWEEWTEPYEKALIEAHILDWCIYCIVSHPELNKMFPRLTRLINGKALKKYDKKYRDEDT